MLETLVLVDATCDVPETALQSGCVSLLPTCVELRSGKVLDNRNAAQTLAFYARMDAEGPRVGHSDAPEVDDIAVLLRSLLAQGRPVLALLVSASRSQLPGRVHDALASVAADSTIPGEAASIKVLDSGNLFAGYGVQLIDLLEQLQNGLGWTSLLRLAHRNIQNTHAYMVPAGLDFIISNAQAKGERSVSLAARLAARIFNVTPILYAHQGATRRVGRRVGLNRAREVLFAKVRRMIRDNRLLSPHVVLSYAGHLADVDLMPGYQRLVTVAREWNVTVHLAMMSMTGAINVGPRALSVGFIARNRGQDSLHSEG